MDARRIMLWNETRRKLLGEVRVEDGRLTLEIDDDYERERLQEVFDRTGEVVWGWGTFEGGEPVEFRARPGTSNWLWFVVANILYPMGYRADFE